MSAFQIKAAEITLAVPSDTSDDEISFFCEGATQKLEEMTGQVLEPVYRIVRVGEREAA